MLVLALVFGALFAWLISEIVTAPEGWEDVSGFHVGKPPQQPSHDRADELRSTSSNPLFHDTGVDRG
jgi:hypothetical protein